MTRAGRGEEAFQALAKQQAAGSCRRTRACCSPACMRRAARRPQAIELLRSALEELPDLPAARTISPTCWRARRGPPGGDRAGAGGARQPAGLAGDRRHARLRLHAPEAGRSRARAVRRCRSSSREPESTRWATAQFHRGLALRELGRQAEAVTALEQALASGADFAEAKDAHHVLAELANTGATPGPEGS